MKVLVKIYDGVKYNKDSKKVAEAKYDIEGYEVITDTDGSKVEQFTDAESVDDNHEYLILHFADGETSTFRNSYCDLFRC
jgi:hypothetical protein